jgi:hypothetical protein
MYETFQYLNSKLKERVYKFYTCFYDIMPTLRIKLSNRLEHKYFGSDINENMTKLSLNRKI